jgi:hypothetical protein
VRQPTTRLPTGAPRFMIAEPASVRLAPQEEHGFRSLARRKTVVFFLTLVLSPTVGWTKDRDDQGGVDEIV